MAGPARYAPVIDGAGLGGLPAFIHREWPLDGRRLRLELNRLIRESGADKRSPEQMAAANNLIWFGTPIALNLYGAVRGSPVEAIDARLRERTGGLCTLQPSKVPVPPTIRRR